MSDCCVLNLVLGMALLAACEFLVWAVVVQFKREWMEE